MKKLSRRQVVLGLGAAGAGAMLPTLVKETRSCGNYPQPLSILHSDT